MSKRKNSQPTILHVIVQILLLLPCSTFGFGYLKRPTEIKKWEHAVVPFKISTTFSTEEAATVLKALALIAHQTCIKFIPCCYHNETDYVHIKTGPGCHSALGRRGGEQIVVLGSSRWSKSCARPGTVEHHLMKTLGFYPEHLRPDRDEYVRIHWENIDIQKFGAFEKHQTALYDPHEIPYDYYSVTHGDYRDFSKNGNKTIVPKFYEVSIGERYGLSEGDIAKISHVYCSSSTKILSNISILFVFVIIF